MIKAVAFDFGGTLYSTKKMGQFTSEMDAAFVEGLMQLKNLTRSESHALYESYKEEWWKRRQRGDELPEIEKSSADLLHTALVRHHIELDKKSVEELLNSFHGKEAKLFSPLSHVTEVIPQLKQMGVDLYILSNNPWTFAIRKSLELNHIETCFKEIITSSMVGIRKPYFGIYEYLSKEAHADFSEILFVGDSYTHDIEVPKKLGMKTCLLNIDGRHDINPEEAKLADFYTEDIRDLLKYLSMLRH